MSVLSSALDLPLGRLLALDLGGARHGAAVCDALGVVAQPLEVIPRAPTRAADFARVAAIVDRERVVGVLVGMPPDPQAAGGRGPGNQARWVKRYAGRLAAALRVPLAFWDEDLSTVDAERLLLQARGHTPVDAAAAALILQDFLEARRSRQQDAHPKGRSTRIQGHASSPREGT